MGSATSQYESVQQNVLTQTLNEQNQVCKATNITNVSGNSIIVSGATVTGNVGITIDGIKTSATCNMSNKVATEISSILQSVLTQSSFTSTSLLSGLDFTDQNSSVTQNIGNYITQIQNSTCNANTITTTNDNFITVNSGADVKGNVGIAISDISSNASCSMVNAAKIVVQNSESAKISQTSTTIGMYGLIAGLAVMAIILCGVTGHHNNDKQQKYNQYTNP